MLNVAILTGRLVADPELRHTKSNLAVTSFTIAVQRPYFKGKEQESDFINIVAWRTTAEFITKYFTKGQLISIEGSIETRKYEDKDGNKRTAFEVVANQVHFAESKNQGKTAETADVKPTDNDFEEFNDDGDLLF